MNITSISKLHVKIMAYILRSNTNYMQLKIIGAVLLLNVKALSLLSVFVNNNFGGVPLREPKRLTHVQRSKYAKDCLKNVQLIQWRKFYSIIKESLFLIFIDVSKFMSSIHLSHRYCNYLLISNALWHIALLTYRPKFMPFS